MSIPHFKAKKALAFMKLVNSLLSSSRQKVQSILSPSPAIYLLYKWSSDRLKAGRQSHLLTVSPRDILLLKLSYL